MSRADHCPRFYGEAVEELHGAESGYFPVVPVPILPNERLWELYRKRHDLTAAERVEWDALTGERGTCNAPTAPLMRAHRDYSIRRHVIAEGHDSSTPTAGHYRMRLRSGAPLVGIRIWHGPPADPVTGEILDRAHRWQAEVNGAPHDVDRLWPAAGRDPISADDYRHFCAVSVWAREHTPNAPLADPTRRVDPLTAPLLI